MKVLMISIDKGLLGQGQLGDVVPRHRQYGEFCEQLDIIVFSNQKIDVNQISPKVRAFSTGSKGRLKYYSDALKLGQRLFAKNQYDLIVTQEPFLTGLAGYKLKKQFGAKLLIHFHGDFWQNRRWRRESKLNYLFLLISKLVVRRADAIRVMSQGQKDKLTKIGIEENKIRTISTPVDIQKFVSINHQECFKAERPIIVHIGRDDVVKDYNTLFRAFNIVAGKYSNARFYQVGGGKNAKRFLDLLFSEAKKTGQKLNLNNENLSLEPLQAQDDLINKYYQPGYMIVLSSTSESFGKVLIEANAAGKPIVSTSTTGAREIIRDEYNGYLAPIGSYNILAEKMIDLLANPDRAQEMGQNGKRLVIEKYGDNLNQIISYWQDIIANKL